MAKITFQKWTIDLPRAQWARILLGVLLLIGGLLWFLPILGMWMFPLGLLVLSVDLPIVRRWRRQFTVWWYNGSDRQKSKADKRFENGG